MHTERKERLQKTISLWTLHSHITSTCQSHSALHSRALQRWTWQAESKFSHEYYGRPI